MITTKRLVIVGGGVLLASLIILVIAIIKATYFEDGAYMVTAGANADHAYRLQVKGTDLRVYEWTPKSNTSYACTFVAGEVKGSVACFPKGTLPTQIKAN